MPPKPRGRPPSSTIPSISQACQTVSGITVDSDELVDKPIGKSQGTGRLPVHHREKKDDASSEVEDSGEESDAEEYAEGPGWG